MHDLIDVPLRDSAEALHQRGLALASEGVGSLPEAIEHFRKAAELWEQQGSEDRKVALRNWGVALSRLERFPEAGEKFRAAIAIDSSYALAYNSLGLVLRDQGRSEEAIECFEQAEQLWALDGSEDRKLALWNAADALWRLDRNAEAEQKFRTAIRVDPAYANGYFGLGLALRDQGKERYLEALEHLEQAEQLWAREGSEDRKFALQNGAETLRLLERYPEAEQKFRAAIGVDPAYATAYNGLGLALRDQGRNEEAIECFEQAEQLWAREGSEDRKFALRNWGNVLLSLERSAEAEPKFREALQVDDRSADSFNDLGIALQRQGETRYEEAITFYARAEGLWAEEGSDNRKLALWNWGNVLRLLGRLSEAEEKFRTAIGVDPAYASAYNSLGLALGDQGRNEEAIECFEQAEQLWAREGSEDRKLALWNAATALRLLERYSEAEETYRMAMQLDDSSPGLYEELGLALHGQGKHEEAIAEYRKAEELRIKEGSADRKYTLRYWAWALAEQENFEQAIEKHRLAVQIGPADGDSYFDLANALADCGRYLEALDVYDDAIKHRPTDPYPYHNKAHFRFHLGQYAAGWEEWRRARQVYEEALRGPLERDVDLARTKNYADVLREVFSDRIGAERKYQAVLQRQPSNTDAWVGLAILYHEWASSERPHPTALSGLSYAVKQASAGLKARNGRAKGWQPAFDLGSFYLDAEDLSAAKEWLERAQSLCDGSRRRSAQVAAQLGVLYARRERYDAAIEQFQEALRAHPENLKWRTNLAEALLKQKQFERAENEYRKVLSMASGNIEALIGFAQLCIEVAESGDADRFSQAEEHLSRAITAGEYSATGSKRLLGRELAQVYYLRGYVRVKRYEADTTRISLELLSLAERDFRTAAGTDPANYRATAALSKVHHRLRTLQRDRVFEWAGPLLVCVLATAIFVFAQLDFFFAGTGGLFPTSRIEGPGYYAMITFGALVFMVAGLYLPKVLKLKVGAIELEKGVVEQISASASLGISR